MLLLQTTFIRNQLFATIKTSLNASPVLQIAFRLAKLLLFKFKLKLLKNRKIMQKLDQAEISPYSALFKDKEK